VTINVKVTNEESDEKSVVVVKLTTPTGKPIPNHPYRELKGGESADFTVYGSQFLQISELNVYK
jgi:hypothetical protein